MKTVFLSSLLFFSTVAWARHVPLSASANLEKSGNVGTDILSGIDAFPGQFPYMGALMLQYSNAYRCGAVLIDESWVLTSSRCTGEAWLLYDVVLGLTDFGDMEAGQPDRLYFTEIYRYPGYDWGPQNDIALLKLSAPIDPTNPYIRPIAIAPDNEDDYVGASCMTMGWGQRSVNNSAEDPTQKGVLQYITTAVTSSDYCEEVYRYDMTTNMCSINGNQGWKGPCFGDEGGPLVCTRDQVSYVVGLLHYVHSPTCYPTSPSYFTRVSLYNSWIRNFIDA